MTDSAPRRDGAGGRILTVVGPTATGKSDLAIALAQALDGEIVNADAMQLYRGMDVGTAKLPVDQRHGIPHHQLDVLEVTEEASVAAYQAAARRGLTAILDRHRVPILVGGSGLYVRAALDHLDIPPTDPTVRSRWEDRLASEGVEALYAVLGQRDPIAAARIEPRNGRRIVRALEVIELTGKPFSATLPQRRSVWPTTVIGLALDRPALDARIDGRSAAMFDRGLLDEVGHLLTQGLADGRTARTAIGYAQAIACLAGDLSRAEAIAQTATLTRKFARRQQSWFGADPRIGWLPADAPDLLDQALVLWRAAQQEE